MSKMLTRTDPRTEASTIRVWPSFKATLWSVSYLIFTRELFDSLEKLTCWERQSVHCRIEKEKRQTHNKINSTALPRLMFNRDPIVSPASDAIRSVASVKSADSGTIAIAFVVNIHGDGTFAM